jgi:hypothetical protein
VDENLKIFMPIPLGVFRPHAYYDEGMDDLEVLTRDTQTATEWLGIVHLMPIVHGQTHAPVGFRLTCARYLRGKRKRRFMPTMLAKAWWSDMKGNTERRVTQRSLSALYLKAFWLLFTHPRTLMLRA